MDPEANSQIVDTKIFGTNMKQNNNDSESSSSSDSDEFAVPENCTCYRSSTNPNTDKNVGKAMFDDSFSPHLCSHCQIAVKYSGHNKKAMKFNVDFKKYALLKAQDSQFESIEQFKQKAKT